MTTIGNKQHQHIKFQGEGVKSFFVILDEDGDVIALDAASGGCHYKATSFSDAKLWSTFREAGLYLAVAQWNNIDTEWKIVQVWPEGSVFRSYPQEQRNIWRERNDPNYITVEV